MNAFRLLSRLVTMAIVLIFVTAHSHETDQDLTSRLVGEWEETRVLDCEGHQQTIYLNANGSFEIKGLIRSCNGKTNFVLRGKWQVKNGKFKYTTTFVDPVDFYRVGVTFEDEILSLDSKEWVMREQSTGNKSVAHRVR